MKIALLGKDLQTFNKKKKQKLRNFLQAFRLNTWIKEEISCSWGKIVNAEVKLDQM